MAKLKLRFLWVVVLLCAVCVADDKNTKAVAFQDSADNVFNAAVKVAQVNWAIKFMDRPTLTFTFETPDTSWSSYNGMLCSVSMENSSDGVRVSLHYQPSRTGGGATKGADKIVARFFDGIRDELAKHKQMQKSEQ